jgi:VanZ family protein
VSRSHPHAPTVAFALAILVASAANPRWLGTAGAQSLPALAPALHFVAYAVLAAVVVPLVGIDLRGVAAAVLLATAYGAGMELLQAGLAYRTASVADLAVNGVGAVLGGTARAVRKRRASDPDDG